MKMNLNDNRQAVLDRTAKHRPEVGWARGWQVGLGMVEAALKEPEGVVSKKVLAVAGKMAQGKE